MSRNDNSHKLSELRYLIRSWKEGHDRFQEIVSCGVGLQPSIQRDLSRYFQVSDGTVCRWMTGVARPAQRLKELIVEFLRLKLLND